MILSWHAKIASRPALSKTIIFLRGVQRLWVRESSAGHQAILPMAKEAVEPELPSQRLEENAPGGKSGSYGKKYFWKSKVIVTP